MRLALGALALLLSSCAARCSCSSSTSAPDAAMPDVAPPPPPTTTKVIVSNATDAGATVNVSVGSDSVVQPASWAFCGVDAGLTCTFPLAPFASQVLPTSGEYLNASIAFNGPVGCGSTIAEFTANNANGYGTADISLVNGWSADVQMLIDTQSLGPATSGDNSKVSGVFPVACDICVARSQPPCNFDAGGCTTSGSCGCKTGTQYNPTVPCQVTYQQADAGSLINVQLLP